MEQNLPSISTTLRRRERRGGGASPKQRDRNRRSIRFQRDFTQKPATKPTNHPKPKYQSRRRRGATPQTLKIKKTCERLWFRDAAQPFPLPLPLRLISSRATRHLLGAPTGGPTPRGRCQAGPTSSLSADEVSRLAAAIDPISDCVFKKETGGRRRRMDSC